jgi:integrase
MRFRASDGGSRTKTFGRKLDAERFRTELQHSQNVGSFVDPSLGKRTFASYSTTWLSTKAELRPRTKVNVEGRLRNHIVPVFGATPLAAIRPEHVRQWVATLTEDKGLAPATVKAAYLVRAGNGDSGDRRSDWPHTVHRDPTPPHVGGEEPTFLTPDEIATLSDTISPRFRALVMTAAYCGLRAGELSALRTERVNFLRSRISVVEAMSEVRGRLVVGPTKTGAIRDVPDAEVPSRRARRPRAAVPHGRRPPLLDDGGRAGAASQLLQPTLQASGRRQRPSRPAPVPPRPQAHGCGAPDRSWCVSEADSGDPRSLVDPGDVRPIRAPLRGPR